MPITQHSTSTPAFSAPSPRKGVPTHDVPDTPEARRHAEEARQLDAELKAFGIEAEQVAPTRNGRGHVRLNFEQVRKLLGV